MEIAQIIAALLKITIEGYAAFAKTQGLTDEQINAVFDQVHAEVLARDPANLPS